MKLTRKVNATLPAELEEKTIKDLRIGESAWTMYWAVWVDRKRQCWLHPDYPAHDVPGGTVATRVTRQTDGYLVELPAGTQFKPQDGPRYVGQSHATQWIPVTKIGKVD